MGHLIMINEYNHRRLGTYPKETIEKSMSLAEQVVLQDNFTALRESNFPVGEIQKFLKISNRTYQDLVYSSLDWDAACSEGY
jgi:hypothetical protein